MPQLPGAHVITQHAEPATATKTDLSNSTIENKRGEETPMDFSTVKAAVDKLGGALTDALRPVMPGSVTYEGKTYRLSSVSNAQQMAWYFAAVARTQASAATAALNALKKKFGLPFDASADLPLAYDAEFWGLDMIQVGVILTILFPVIAIPNLALALLAGLSGPIADAVQQQQQQEPAYVPPDSVGDSGTPPKPSGKDLSNTEVKNTRTDDTPVKQSSAKKEGFLDGEIFGIPKPLALGLGFLLLRSKKVAAP